MKALLALGIAMAAVMQAAECVTVSLVNPSAVPPAVLVRGKVIAAGIFSEIGVELRWDGRRAKACGTHIEVELTCSAGPEDRPGSLAYASVGVGAGRRVHVYVDRVNMMVPAADRGALLGHVFAHEITHILEGVPRHSGAGVMKAHWETDDLRALRLHPLRFELVDQALIHAGLTPNE